MMRCANPYVSVGGQAFGCGQCLPCRINRKRIWTHRIMLESLVHQASSFVTLTYDEEHLPENASLYPRDLTLFFKRLRKSISPTLVRYYAVGEYGDLSQRPHYHVALFGYGCLQPVLSSSGMRGCGRCQHCSSVQNAWGKGHVSVDSLSPQSAQYIAGYVTKKMTARDDPRLFGRYPEFSRSSKHGGGIGAGALDAVALQILRLGLDKTQADVPSALRHGNKLLPLGRYLQRRLRKLVGKDEAAPEETLKAIQETLRPLQEAARASSDEPSLKHQILKSNKGARDQIAGRAQIYKQRKSI